MNTRFVTSLELSRKLKEAGVSQESSFYWWEIENKDSFLSYCDDDYSGATNSKCFSAYTAGELAELLPETIQNKDFKEETYFKPTCFLIMEKAGTGWMVDYKNRFDTCYFEIFHENLIEAMSLMLLKLKEEGVV